MSEAELLCWTAKNRITVEDLLDVFTGVAARPRELGQNVLGLALMEVRADLTGNNSVVQEWRRAHMAQLNHKGERGFQLYSSRTADHHRVRRRLDTRPLTDEEKFECLERQKDIDEVAKNPRKGRETVDELRQSARPVRFDEPIEKPSAELVGFIFFC